MDDNRKFGILAGVSMIAFSVGMGPAWAQETAEAAAPEVTEQRTLDTIVVTGFRQSLSEALDVKRNTTGSVDAILAEDIADFPDQNLAESLQRIPGVAITRESGEGREITVRGLGGEYTRVRVNGMEAIAGTGGASTNTGRGFDFNVFASELFNQIVVYKTASAELDEGSLGAVVDLSTGHPLDYEEGLTGAVNVQGQYSPLSEAVTPRLSGLLSYKDPNGVWGVSGSVAYSKTETVNEGQNTVRWQKARFQSVGGVDCVADPNDTGCATVTDAFHPRIPRYGQTDITGERLGLTGSFQWAPTDAVKLTIDGLYSELDGTREQRFAEVLFRGNEGGMDVLDYTYDASTNNLTSMTVNNAFVRNELFAQGWNTKFNQVSARLEHEFTDTLRGDLLIGTSKSELTVPYETTFMIDNTTYDNFFYDYSNDEFPVIAFNGQDVTDPDTFYLNEFRNRPAAVNHGFDTISYSLEKDVADSYTLSGGLTYKKFSFDRYGARADTSACASGLVDCSIDGVNGLDVTSANTDLYTFGGDVGDGSTITWLVPNLDAWADETGIYNIEPTPRVSDIYEVEEEDLGAFVKFAADVELGGRGLRYDIGVRYAETKQTSTGTVSGSNVVIEREPYSDVLPSINIAYDLTDDIVLRAAAAKVMTRPGLGNLTPNSSVDSFNYKVSGKNPFLNPTRATNFDISAEWYFAEDALFSIAVFHKDIESFPISTEVTDTFASTGLPLSVLQPTSPTAENPEGGPLESCNPANGGSGCWTISTLGDGPGAKISGAEFSFQVPFSTFTELAFVSDMGFVGNYTMVDSDVDYTFGSEVISERLLGMSKSSYNATVYYENDKLSARIAAAYRDDYITSTSGNSNVFEGYAPSLRVDFSSSYSLTESLGLSFEALNLTDEYTDRFTDLENDRRYEYEHTGRVFMVGAKYKF
ncbi:TonB-dependent receptor [Hirschia baltica]|uniref:TonB-dependent receptor n=1 Tax=Hirschia baltica (strain ATCC 49814 / DSM 5838 / IFAM 1418) TaxID=582402 RepID=C6XQH9_HIRBI|nr:TonB-dependent receptor [Hirschia baltica]ACT60478.1 TonB-dependent receptor [Hirschia baltica ATCC 49814]